MNFADTVSLKINEFFSFIYSVLTEFFQSINLDEHLAIFCEYNVLSCFVVFALVATYFIVYDKDRTISSLYSFLDPIALVVMAVFLILYAYLMDRPLSLARFGLGVVNLTPFILMVIAYYYGAIPAAVFGVAEYLITCISSKTDPMMIALFFIYATGGLIHGFFIYGHRIRYWRCLVARVITVVLCNIILLSFVRGGIFTHESPPSVFIPATLVSNILTVPIQALVGYIVLRFIRMFVKKFRY